MAQLSRCNILTLRWSGLGQNLRLPQRNIGGRLTSVSKHYASEAVPPFLALEMWRGGCRSNISVSALSMSSFDSDFVLRAIQVFGSTIAKAWRCRALNSFSDSTVSNSVNTSGGLTASTKSGQ